MRDHNGRKRKKTSREEEETSPSDMVVDLVDEDPTPDSRDLSKLSNGELISNFNTLVGGMNYFKSLVDANASVDSSMPSSRGLRMDDDDDGEKGASFSQSSGKSLRLRRSG